jgi:SH3 domain-containing YSC84-like protein 1
MRTTVVLIGIVLLSASAAAAKTHGKEARRITDATAVVQELRSTPDKEVPQDLWDRARCVAVIPGLKKAAFIVGGEYGKGLVSCRTNGKWSAPSFLELERGSWGAQIGAESVDLVLVVMNDHGMSHLLQNRVALGGEASVAAGPVGRDARAATDAQLRAEILSYSRAQGLFAGIDLAGGVIRPDQQSNKDLYGRALSAHDIVLGKGVRIPEAARPFVEALRHAGAD